MNSTNLAAAFVGLFVLLFGIILRKYPEKFIKLPFFFRGPGFNLKSFLYGSEKAFGKKEAIIKIQNLGTYMMLIGLIFLITSPFLPWN